MLLVASVGCGAPGDDADVARGGAGGASAASTGASSVGTGVTSGNGGSSNPGDDAGNAGGQAGQGGSISNDAGDLDARGPDFPDAGDAKSPVDSAPPIGDGGPSSLVGKKGLWDLPGLLRIRAQASTGALKPAYDQLIMQAEMALTVGPFSVMNKTTTPPSGDKHDYSGLARYYWPDPTKPDGLPYISKDGQSNPDVDSDKYDYHSMFTMSGSVTTLGLAYFFTRNEKYATKAHDLLKTWYIDAATKMNPNLNYAQSVPGLATGRQEGIIDTLQMAYMIDALEMLRDSPAFSPSEWDALSAWFTSFLDWLRTSTFGKGEEAASNNHGSWYDVQTMRYAIFLGNTTLATQLATMAESRRIAAQINPDGSEPQEISRTNSLFYSEYDCRANFDIAQLAVAVGVDLYGYKTTDGRSVRKALDYLAPYADPSKTWPNQQIMPDDRSQLVELLRRASVVYNAPSYEMTLERFYAATLPTNIVQLVYPQ
jgi:hypothetical protein